MLHLADSQLTMSEATLAAYIRVYDLCMLGIVFRFLRVTVRGDNQALE